MSRAPRPLFRRTDRKTGKPIIYIAVKPIMTGSKATIQPGEEVNLRPHQLRSLYQRRRIGPKGHPWTEQALASKGYPLGFTTDREQPAQVAAFEDGFPIRTESGATIGAETFAAFVAENLADPEAYAGLTDDEKQVLLGEMVAELDAPAAQALAATESGGTPDEEAAEATSIEPVKIGSQWGYPDLTEKKFTSKKKAKQWLEEQTFPDSDEGGE